MARQVLPIVGAAIGAYFGGQTGAQIGWAIGSVIGNAVDPEVIQGPKIGDIATQTSQEGVPIPIVFALSQPMAGNIIACGTPKIVNKESQQGKGGGPVTTSQSVYRTYAIGICEGPITALIRCWKNGTLVYDSRPGGQGSNNSKFMQYTRIFLGGYDQMPSPDLEAQFGAANTPAHRGLAYIVRANDDLTNLQGAVPQFTFQVLRCEGMYLTSRPYPMLVTDEMKIGVMPIGGSLELTYFNYVQSPDNVTVGVAPQSGSLRNQLQTYSNPIEPINIGVAPQSGTLETILVGYTISIEPIDIGVAPQSGVLDTVLIVYSNPIESINVGVTPQGGTLS
jgi:hypothetical protein